MTEDVRSKGLAVLRDGRLRMMTVRTDANGSLTFTDAIVHGHRSDHAVTFLDGRWSCSCPDARESTDRPGHECAHIYAAEMVAHGIAPPGRDNAPKGRPAPKQRSRT